LNINGEFIGINVALRQDAQGIAFAINAGTVDRFLKQYLGAARMAGVDHGLKCGVKALAETGVGRQRVVINQTAVHSSLQQRDEILAVAERPVTTAFDVERALWDKRPGQQLTLKVVRQGRELRVTLTLAASPGAGTTTAPAASPAPPALTRKRQAHGTWSLVGFFCWRVGSEWSMTSVDDSSANR